MATGIVPNIGRPGIGSSVTAQKNNVSRDGHITYFPGGAVIEGTKTRDPGNTSAGSILSIRGGLLMGKITSSGYYANSIIGVTSGAYTSGGLSLTVSAASALELVRRVGSTGTFTLNAAATAAGTLTTDTVTYSAVNTTTGVITISDIGANRIAGGLIGDTDGSQTPLTFIGDQYPLLIPSDSSDVSYPWLPISAIIDTAKIIDYPTDTTLKNFVKNSLSTLQGGKFVFSDIYVS